MIALLILLSALVIWVFFVSVAWVIVAAIKFCIKKMVIVQDGGDWNV